MKTHRSLSALLCAAALTSCDLFEKNAVRDITAPLPAANVKFFNFGVSSPGVNFYANETKMTAISSSTGSESTTGVTYGNAGSGGLYVGIDPGQYTLTGRIAAATDKDLAISTVAQSIESGKSYSFYQSGIYNSTTKTVDAFVVEDPIPAAVNVAKAHVRFVHAISNANPMTLSVTNTTTTTATTIGAETSYNGATAFVEVEPGTYNLATRYSGATTNAISRTNVSFSGGRVYTITARGNITTASTVALDNTANR
jgi:hypothetical protein